MRFSGAVRAAYPNKQILDEIEARYQRALTLKIPVVRASEISPVAKTPLKIQVLLQVGLRRALELTESFIRAVNDQLFAPTYVTARALLECVVLLYEIWSRVERVVTDWDRTGLKELDEKSMAALLGSKSDAWVGDPEQFQAVNILTIIDRLTKSLGPSLRKFYDALSEHAHPNYSGMLGAYHRPDLEEQQSVLIDKPAQEKCDSMLLAVNAVSAALEILQRAQDGYQLVLYDFTRLCEEDIYEGGTWPHGLPYPLHPLQQD